MASPLLPPKQKKWPKYLGISALVLVVLYFVLTSGAFLKAVVLPQVGGSLGSDLSVSDVSLSPFSSLSLQQVKLTPKGEDTLATVAEVRVRYSLVALLSGNLKVEEVTVDSPVITVLERADGTGNLQKLLGSLGKSQKSSSSKQSSAAKLDVRNVTLKNATLRQTRQVAGGKAETVEITGLNITLDQLGNAASGKLTIAGALGMSKATGDQLAAKIGGSFSVALDGQLHPQSLKGDLNLDVTSATGAFKDVTALGTALNLDLSATELTQLRLAFRQQGQDLGRLSLRGPYDLEKKETRITYEIAGIDRRVLGIAGALIGIDFGATTLSATGRVDVAQLGTLLASNGRLTVSNLSLTTTNGVTPTLDIALDYKASLSLSEKTALIERAELAVTQKGRELVRGTFDRPMNIAWDRAQPGFREASYTLTLSGLDLASWRPLAGPSLPSGTVDTSLKITAQNDGRMLKFTLGSGVRNVVLDLGSRRLSELALSLQVTGSLEDFVKFNVDELRGDLRHRDQSLASWNGLVHYHSKDQELGTQLDGQVSLPAVLAIYPVENVMASSGALKFSVQYGAKVGGTNASTDLTLSDFTGSLGTMQFKDYQASVAAAVDLLRGTITLQRMNVVMQDNFKAGGSVDMNGKYDLASKKGKLDFKSSELNQNALAPFVAAAIAPNRLVSIGLDLNGSATFDLAGESRVQGGIKVANFIVDDPAKRLPTTPLGFGINFDVSQKGSVTDLHSLQLGLGPTATLANELLIAGKIDLGTNAPSPSSLSLKSDGLDFTALYNLFAGGATTNKPAASATPAKGTITTPAPKDTADAEPAAIRLPFQQFDLDVNLAKVLLREVVISNWVTKVSIRQSVVTLDPFSLGLNGAPVTAKGRFDVGVPGYTYDLTLNGDAIPLPPFVNSFQPERTGQIGGTVVVKAALKGAGVTGTSLGKNLNGQVDVAATNLNLKVGDVKSPILKTVVNIVIGLPELIRSPGLGTLGKLTGLGGGSQATGWVDEFSQSPISSITAHAVAGGGKVDLQKAEVLSPAFQIDAKGPITFAPVLTNSTIELPVAVALKDSLAKKVGLTSTGAAYTPMPDFLTVRGTLGVPKPDIAYSKLALLAGKAGLGIVGGTAGAVGDKAAGLLNLLGGGTKTNAAPAATNAPNLINNALDLIGKPKTNAAPADPNAPKPKFNPLDLFNKPKN